MMPTRQAEELVDAAHPLGVALGQIIVDRDDVDALAFERVQIDGQRGDQRLAFAGFHFGDLAAVQDDAADQLDVEMPHVEDAAAGFAADGEGFDQQIVERCAVGDALLEFDGFGGQIDIGELLDRGFQIVDSGDDWTDPLTSRSFLVPKIFARVASSMGGGLLLF